MPSPSLVIDIVPALLVLAAAFSAVCAVVFIALRDAQLQLRYWAAGGATIAPALLLITLRGQVPDSLSILVANLGLIGGHVLLTAGTAAFRNQRHDWAFAAGALFAVSFTFVYATDAGLEVRVAVISCALALFSTVMIIAFAGARLSFGVAIAQLTLTSTVALSLLRLGAVFNLIDVPDGVPQLNGLVLSLGILGAVGIATALLVLGIPIVRPRLSAAGMDLPLPPDEPGALVWRLARDRNVLVSPDGIELPLTGNEFLVLRQLANGEMVMRPDLNAAIGRDSVNPKDRGIDVLISRLRRKCSEAGIDLPITSVRGQGYVFHGELRHG